VFYDSATVSVEEWNGTDFKWHNLAIQIDNSELVAWRDGKIVFEHYDTALAHMPTTGYIELSNTYQATCFDDVLLSSTGEEQFLCGDADSNDVVNVSDAVFLVNYIFGGGPPPEYPESGDGDCSGNINISDAVYLIVYIFAGGSAPCFACP
jgi:hypothetical protein